jgi:hypothetical protein
MDENSVFDNKIGDINNLSNKTSLKFLILHAIPNFVTLNFYLMSPTLQARPYGPKVQ